MECGCRESHPDMLPGEEPFWLLNYNRCLPGRSRSSDGTPAFAQLRGGGLHFSNYIERRLEIKRARNVMHSWPLPFQQRTNTSCYLLEIPTHGFTVVLSVFRGTPPPKPLNCKSVSNRLGAQFRPAWIHHTGGTPKHSCA